MLLLNLIADLFKPGLGLAGKSMHHLGFRRGYYVGAVTGVVVTFLFLQLTGCASEGSTGTPCAIDVSRDEVGELCYTGVLEDDALACCPEDYVGVGYDADLAVICVPSKE